jgi:hypothetical protein
MRREASNYMGAKKEVTKRRDELISGPLLTLRERKKHTGQGASQYWATKTRKKETEKDGAD